MYQHLHSNQCKQKCVVSPACLQGLGLGSLFTICIVKSLKNGHCLTSNAPFKCLLDFLELECMAFKKEEEEEEEEDVALCV